MNAATLVEYINQKIAQTAEELATSGTKKSFCANSCVIIPDYGRLYKLERQRQHKMHRRDVVSLHKPFFRCCLKKQYTDPHEMNKVMQQIDYRIDREITKELKASHFAFVTLNSMEAVHRLVCSIT